MKISIYRHYWIYFLISALFLLPGLFSLFTHGLLPGIDFTGGSLLTIETSESSAAADLTETNIRAAAEASFSLASVKHNADGQAILRLPSLSNDEKNQLLDLINQTIPVTQVSFDSVGAIMGQELISKIFAAIIIASIILIIYLRLRFRQISYGIAALLGVVHDVTIICGIFSILGWFYHVEVDVLFVTAMLTTISFSVHDTVVIYDRIRELKRQFPQASLKSIADAAVLATISRSFNNSLTIIFMLLALLLLGGVTLRYFALALLLGVVFGTYSSPFCSVPLLLLMNDWQKKRKKPHGK
jgi:preprotein translocase subunit SecF